MKLRLHPLTLPIFIFSLVWFSTETISAAEVPVLKIPRLKTDVQIDGNLTETCYKKHKPLTDFRIAADAKNQAPRTRAWIFWHEDH